MSDQWAKVPLDLLSSVSPSAVVLYACIAAHAHRERLTCKLSNETLVDRTTLSLTTVKAAKRELIEAGLIEHDGAQGRGHVPTYRLLKGSDSDRFDHTKGSDSDLQRGRIPTHRTEVVTEVDKHSLRECADESEADVKAAPEEPMFEVEAQVIERPVVQACVAAFMDAYGTEPISRPMIGRLGKQFKALAATYSRAELLNAAAELGAQKCANPNAVEPFLLRARSPQMQAQAQRRAWARLAADSIGDPFAQPG